MAAGLGSRMQPLTHFIPKPLFPVLNTPSLERILRSLMGCGFTHIYINLFHLASRVLDFLSERFPSNNIHLFPIVEPYLLGTGGALLNAASYFLKDQPLLLINADVVCDLDFEGLWWDHIKSGSIATILVHDKKKYNKLIVRDGLLVGFDEKAGDALAYTGIACFSPAFFHFLPHEMPCSLVDAFQNVLQSGFTIRAIPFTHFSKDGMWDDIGTIEGYLSAHSSLLVLNDCSIYCGSDCRVGKDVHFEEWVCLGDRVRIGNGAIIRSSVIWEDCEVPPNTLIENSIVSTFGMLRL